MSKTHAPVRLIALAASVLLGLACPPVSAQVEPAAPAPVFAPLEMVSVPLHLGYHRPGDLAQGVMTFLNTGDKTLTITEVKSSCDCTLAEASKKVVEPGETVDLFVGMNVSDTLGLTTRDVAIVVEGYERPVGANVSVEIGYPVRFNKGGLRVIATGIRGAFKVDSVDEKPFRVLAVNGQPPQFISFDPAKDAPRAEYELFYDWSEIAREERPRWVVVETDHPGAEMVEMPASVPGVPELIDPRTGWRTIEKRLVLGAIDRGSPTQASVTLGAGPLQAGKPLRITSHNPNLGVRIVSVKPSTKHAGAVEAVIQFNPSSTTMGYMHAVVEFETEGHTCGVDVYARVRVPASGGG